MLQAQMASSNAEAPADYTQAVRKAESLMPTLRERVKECEALRQLPESTANDIRSSGIARILQPARFGGYEAPLVSMVDVLTPIGYACGATAWCLAQYIIHNYMVARWPLAAQEKVWKEKPDALVSGILIPLLGKARRTEGGFLLTGKWPFVTGVNPSDWCILSAMAENAEGSPIESYFLVRTDEITIRDTWYGIGLKGSGSNDVEVKDLFVAEEMVVTVDHMKGGQFAGRKANPSALFRPPVYMTFGILLSTAVLGMAEFMFEEYLTQSRNRVTLMSGKESGSFQAQQINVGEASASLQAAAALLRADCHEIMEIAAEDRPFTDIERTNYRCNAAFASRLAYEAAQKVWNLAGARAAYEDNDIGRVFRDILVATRHVTQNWDANATEHGRARVKLALTNPSL